MTLFRREDLRRLAVATAGLAFAAAPVAPAFAQTETPPASAAPATPDLTDEQVTLFAETAIKVGEIANSYRTRMEAETDAAAQQELAQQANEEMLSTVESAEGITVQEYIAIGQAVQDDPELSARIMQRVDELMAEG